MVSPMTLILRRMYKMPRLYQHHFKPIEDVYTQDVVGILNAREYPDDEDYEPHDDLSSDILPSGICEDKNEDACFCLVKANRYRLSLILSILIAGLRNAGKIDKKVVFVYADKRLYTVREALLKLVAPLSSWNHIDTPHLMVDYRRNANHYISRASDNLIGHIKHLGVSDDYVESIRSVLHLYTEAIRDEVDKRGIRLESKQSKTPENVLS
jgi:hypothetical protein